MPHKKKVNNGKLNYEKRLSLEVLRKMRKSESFTKSIKMVGISQKKAKNLLKDAIVKKNGRWKARKSDHLERSMQIYSDGQIKKVKINDFKIASQIGQYFATLRQFFTKKDIGKLLQFSNILFKDKEGLTHTFETDPKQLLKINESIEEPEFVGVYVDEMS